MYDGSFHHVSLAYKFTGYERDAESGLDNAQARYNSSSLGRFMSPDPANTGADQTNPQSWNMYSYVLNNPLPLIDPTGLECVWDDGSYDSPGDPVTGSGNGCSAQGGTWVDHSYFQLNGLADWSADPNQDIANIAGAIQNNTANTTVIVYGNSPQYFISADPDWFHSVQYECIGQGAKAGLGDFFGGMVFAPEIGAAVNWFDEANMKNAVTPLAMTGTAVDVAKRGADYVAENRGVAKGIKSAVRGVGGDISANEVQRAAKLGGKAAAVAGVLLSGRAGYQAYKVCMAR